MKNDHSVSGRIYFLQAIDGGPIKIGFAQDVRARMKGLQTANHTKLACLVHIAGTMDDERLIHEEYAAHRMSGEWFNDSPEIRALIVHAKANHTAETLQAKSRKTPSRGEPRIPEAYRNAFQVYAVAIFGEVRTVQKLADAASVTYPAAANWMKGKSDPSVAAVINICRTAPTMFVWLASTVVGGIISEVGEISDDKALAIIGRYPEFLMPFYWADEGVREAVAVLLAHIKSPSADCLRFLEEFSRDSIAHYQKQCATDNAKRATG